jgi:hypothetical protein
MGIRRGSISTPIIVDGLVFHVDAANRASYPKTGTTWVDTVGNMSGTLTNGPTFDSANGGSIDFDGTSDIVEFGSSNLLTGDNCQSATLCGWVKWTSTLSGYIASIKRGMSDSTLLSISINQKTAGASQAGTACVVLRNAANSAHTYTFYDGNYDDDVWHNVVGRVNGSTIDLFVDGVAVNQSTAGMQDVSGNTANFTIGAFATGNPVHDIEANIAQVSFYRRAISDSEILHNYNALKGRFGL